MASELSPAAKPERKIEINTRGGSGTDTIYGLGLIGAWAYYIGRATTWEGRIAGFFKGLVWPAFVVYDLLKFLEKEWPSA